MLVTLILIMVKTIKSKSVTRTGSQHNQEHVSHQDLKHAKLARRKDHILKNGRTVQIMTQTMTIMK